MAVRTSTSRTLLAACPHARSSSTAPRRGNLVAQLAGDAFGTNQTYPVVAGQVRKGAFVLAKGCINSFGHLPSVNLTGKNYMLTFVQAHWLTLFTAWVAANFVLSPLAEKVPATTWYGKALHVFVAISPMDVMKAIKTVGAEVSMLPLAGAGLVMLLSLGCASKGAAQPTSTPTVQVNPQAVAQAVADAFQAAWVDAYVVCRADATETGNDTVRQSCNNVLTPIRNSLLLMQSAVSAWSDANQQNFPCLVVQVVSGFQALKSLVPTLTPTLPQSVTDALTLASSYSFATCGAGAADGGVQ